MFDKILGILSGSSPAQLGSFFNPGQMGPTNPSWRNNWGHGFGLQNPLADRKSAALTGLGLGLIGSPTDEIAARGIGGALTGAGAYGAFNQPDMGMMSGIGQAGNMTPGILGGEPLIPIDERPSMSQIHPDTRSDILGRFRGLY